MLEAIRFIAFDGDPIALEVKSDALDINQTVDSLFYGYRFDFLKNTKGLIKQLSNPITMALTNNPERTIELRLNNKGKNTLPSISVRRGEKIKEYQFGYGGESHFHERIASPNTFEEANKCFTLSTSNIVLDVLFKRWNNIVLTDTEDDVAESMRIIDANIQRISPLLSNNNNKTPTFMVKLSNYNKPVPLKSLGEGIQRIFEFALTFVNAKDAIVLIDEVENGLHYSIQPKIWDFILKLSQKHNVQVFATTHSWDCIKAFQQASEKNNDVDCQMIRIDKVEDQFRAKLIDTESLESVIKHGIEVR